MLVLAKRTAPPIEQIITDPAGRYVFSKFKNTADAVLALYSPSGTTKERRRGRQMLIRLIKKLLLKKINRKNNLILLGDFNMTLGNKDRSTGNKDFCESQAELMNLIKTFGDLWRCQNPNDRSYTHFHGRSNTYSRIDWAYTSTNLRVEPPPPGTIDNLQTPKS